jgi:hypothetical protein
MTMVVYLPGWAIPAIILLIGGGMTLYARWVALRDVAASKPSADKD